MKIEGIEENYIAAFNTLNLSLLANIKNCFQD